MVAKPSGHGSGARTIGLIRLIAESGGEFSLTELSQRAGLPPSSVHRLIQPLLDAGLVARAQGGSYRTGREFYRLAATVLHQIHFDVMATPFLRGIWDKWQETAVFCLYRPAERVALVAEIIQSPHPLRHVIEPFASISLLWGSLGRAILAHLKAEEIAAVRREGMIGPITGSIGPELDRLLPELAQARARGIAVYRNEEADIAGIASPVFRSESVVIGSIGVTMPVRRFDRLDADELGRDIRKAAADLGETLGHKSRDLA